VFFGTVFQEVLDAVRTPLALGDLAEDAETLVKEFIDNTVFGLGF